MTQGRNISNPSDYTIGIDSFEITLSDVPGLQNWGLKGQDESLKARLSQSRLVSDLERIGNHPSLRFDAGKKNLGYHEDIQPRLVPKPERFQALLRLLDHLADLNQELNRRD